MPMATRFIAAVLSYAVLDGLWLGAFMSGFYRRELWSIARTSGDALAPNWGAALLVYPLLALGIAGFVVPRADSVAAAAGWGAVFGLVVYGTYDLTNFSTLRGYSVQLAVVDMAWGMFASAAAAVVATTAERWMRG